MTKVTQTGRQAITTKYLGPTNTRGSRIKASAWAGSVTVPYDDELDQMEAHAAAARALIEKLGWGGSWRGGGSPTGCGYVFVNAGD